VVATQSLLSRTGTNVVRYGTVALGLLVAGGMLVVAARRRSGPAFGRR
jgi:hypothetical protein